MPENPTRKAALAAAVADGRVSREALDTAVGRVLTLVARAAPRGLVPAVDTEAHQRLAVRLAARSAVLLRNEGDLLPLGPDLRIAVIGRAAVRPVIQGSGSATTRPTRVVSPLEAIRVVAGTNAVVDHTDGHGADGRDAAEEEKAVAAARGADVAVMFVHTAVGRTGRMPTEPTYRSRPGRTR